MFVRDSGCLYITCFVVGWFVVVFSLFPLLIKLCISTHKFSCSFFSLCCCAGEGRGREWQSGCLAAGPVSAHHRYIFLVRSEGGA